MKLLIGALLFAVGLLLSVGFAAALRTTINYPLNTTYNITGFTVNVSTDLLANVTFQLNDGPFLLPDFVINSTYLKNISSQQGSNKVFVNGTFNNGTNETQEANATVFFTVDSIGPTVVLRSPADGFTTDNPLNTFEFVPTDPFLSTIACSFYLNDVKIAGPVNVVNDTRGKFAVALGVGTYQWNVKCEDNLSNKGFQAPRTITLNSKCGVDARELTGKGDLLSLVLENTGTLQEEVDYTIKVNLNDTATGYARLGVGEKKEVLHNFTFNVGNYQLEASAKSDCGAQDYVSAGYAKTSAPSDCTNPLGVHGSYRGEALENKIFKCNNGFWEFVSSDSSSYCSATTISRCGDGIVNCGETKDTCAIDYNISVQCHCGNNTLYVENKSRSVQEFFNTCKSTCNLDCNIDPDCQSGLICSDFRCVGKPVNCGVEIRDFDYTKQIAVGERGQIFANIKNTGSVKENITARVLVDNGKLNETSFVLNSGSDKLSAFTYSSSVGQHSVILEAAADCGSKASESVKLIVRNISVSALPDVPLATSVSLQAENIETVLGAEKPILVNVKTTKPQIFNLKVTGVSPDWLNYPSTVGVSDERSVTLFVKPKEKGDYNITIFFEGKEQNFTTTARLKVRTEAEEISINQKLIIALVVSVAILFSLAFFLASRLLHL